MLALATIDPANDTPVSHSALPCRFRAHCADGNNAAFWKQSRKPISAPRIFPRSSLKVQVIVLRNHSQSTIQLAGTGLESTGCQFATADLRVTSDTIRQLKFPHLA